MKEKIIVMGAGIQGICCALALSHLNVHITIIDKTHEPLLRSGLRNEGKIHLGFVYANDNSFRTASLMLRSALQFSPLMESFFQRKIDWQPLRSRKFNYLILNETLLPAQKILEHYERLQKEYQLINDSSLHYIGARPMRLWEEKDLAIEGLNRTAVSHCIPTEEVALDLTEFRKLLLQEIAKRKNISFAGGHSINEIKKTSYGYSVNGNNTKLERWSFDCGLLINCLWENRLLFDQQLGIEQSRKWMYRLKNRILGKAPSSIARLNSFTCVLGAFGDIVNYTDQLTYLSWYPACMSGWSSELTTPDAWENACNGQIKLEDNRAWVNKALKELDHLFPGMIDFEVLQIDGGIIFTWGKTDIIDMQSELHNRYEIGVQQYDDYFSIDTVKFTSAPLFAHNLKLLL
jgi:hypothetical protein